MAAGELRPMSTNSPRATDLFRLDGRIAFVSGAAGHLGRAMALTLADAGAHVIVNGRDPKPLEDLVAEIEARKGSAAPAAFDIGDVATLRVFFTSRARLDIIVNNAISMTPRPFGDLSEEDFDQTYRTGVVAPFEIARAALPALRTAARETGQASIINIASMYGTVSPDARLYARAEQASPFHYGPAKAALLQMTRHLAAEFGREGIRVNALVPGPFPRDSVIKTDPQFAERLAAKTMLARVAHANEICGPLLFLASPASSFVTGAALAVDGGWTAW